MCSASLGCYLLALLALIRWQFALEESRVVSERLGELGAVVGVALHDVIRFEGLVADIVLVDGEHGRRDGLEQADAQAGVGATAAGLRPAM